jgi:hypothetical protein
VLAELAVYGEIRHVEPLMFWRRHGGKDVASLARGCSQFTQRNLPHDDDLADLFWRLPLVGTAYAHVERFAVTRIPNPQRRRLMDDVGPIFRQRWMPMMRQEAARFRADFPELVDHLARARGATIHWVARQLAEALAALETLLPDLDWSAERLVLQASYSS